ncbi:MAG: DUF2341 domain-containing protein [Candidatus Methylomirabilales bacterium]
MRTLPTVKQNWSQVGRWAAAACLLLLALAWASPALAATPAWWDCNYGYRKQITVTTGTSAVPNGYTVSLTFDHAALVSAVPSKSLASGNDVRVLYWTGAAWVEVNRVIDSASSWNNAATKIWFNLMAAISSSSSDNNYYLYYGNPAAGAPPGGGSSSLIFSDGFESGNLTAWSGNSNGWGSPGDVIAALTEQPRIGGSYSGKSTTDTDGTSGSEADVLKDFADQTTLYAKLYVRLKSPFPGAGTDYVTLMRFVDNTPDWKNIITTTIDDDRSLYLWNDSCSNGGNGTCEAYGWQAPGRTILNMDRWYMIEMVATVSQTAGEARLWIDGNLEISVTGKNLGSNLINRFTAGISWTSPWGASNTLYIDDVTLTLWQNPALTTSLGTELAQDCPPPGPSLCNWQYKRKLTFNNSAQAQNLIDFPVLVVLNSSRINYGQTQDAGQDLRFTDSDGVTLLAHEIEQWNEAGTSYVWVKVPQIDASSTTDYIWMYYGNASASDGQNKTAVWDGNFKMVHHLKETTGPHRDSTSNANDSVAIDVGTQGSAAGQINGADNFIRASAHNVDVADSGSLDMAAADSFTVEAWVNTTFTAGWQIVVSKENVGVGSEGEVQLWTNNGTASFWLNDGTNYARADSATGVANGAWHYLVGRWTEGSPGTAQIFVDGASVASGSNSLGAIQTATPLVIGEEGDSNRGGNFDGRIDEVRVSKTARSDAWISAQYKSMTDTFITPWGSEQSNGTSVGSFTPDAVAAGMSVPVTFVGNVCQVPATFTTSSSDIVIGPSIVTDATGTVVTANGTTLSTVFFIKPDARPTTGVTVTIDGKLLTQTFDIVLPTPDPNVTLGTVSLTGRTKRGTKVLGGLTVTSGATLNMSTTDIDTGTAGNQAYLPFVILVKGDINIAGTLDLNGQNGANGGAGSGGIGGAGGPGGGGGAGGGALQDGSAAGGGNGFSGGGGGGSKGTGTGGAGGSGTGAAGSGASGTTGGAGGIALSAATGGGGGMADTSQIGGAGGGGGTGNPSGTGGSGGLDDGGPGGQGGGGGGASGGGPGGGGGGGFATAGGQGPDTIDGGYGGSVNGSARLVALAGGSGGGGGGPDTGIALPSRGGGGGGGGGAVLIYATGSVTVSGTITAVGGNGGNGHTSGIEGSGGGGGGSGGAIFLQSGTVTASGTLNTAGGLAGTSTATAGGGAGGTGRIRIDGLATGGTVPGTPGSSKFIGPVIDTLVGTTVTGRAEGGSTVTLYVYYQLPDGTSAQVTGSPYTTSASGSSGTVGTWTINNVTFPLGTGYLAVKQSSGSTAVLGPGRATKGLHLINWREVY